MVFGLFFGNKLIFLSSVNIVGYFIAWFNAVLILFIVNLSMLFVVLSVDICIDAIALFSEPFSPLTQ